MKALLSGLRLVSSSFRSPGSAQSLVLLPVRSFSLTPRMAQAFVEDKVTNNPVVVFSKTYCPFCTMAKQSLKDAGLDSFVIIELDQRDDASAIQDFLLKKTGARTVPRVFIAGKSVGGGTDVQALQKNGKLATMLKDAGAL